MLRRILLGIGGTPFTKVAITRAVELAKANQASITAVTVLDEKRLYKVGPVPMGASEAAADLRDFRRQVTLQHIEEAVTELQRTAQEHGVPCVVHREQGEPFTLMVKYSRYHDLNIFGLRSMFEHDVLGTASSDPARVLRDLIAGGVYPILAVSNKYRTINRVLVAYSGSVACAHSLREFLMMGLWSNVTMRVLVCQKPAEEAEQLLKAAADYCRAYGYTVDTKYRHDDPKYGILSEVSEWDADLLVMGSAMKSWLSQIFVETTMLHIVRNLDRPIFIGS